MATDRGITSAFNTKRPTHCRHRPQHAPAGAVAPAADLPWPQNRPRNANCLAAGFALRGPSQPFRRHLGPLNDFTKIPISITASVDFQQALWSAAGCDRVTFRHLATTALAWVRTPVPTAPVSHRGLSVLSVTSRIRRVKLCPVLQHHAPSRLIAMQIGCAEFHGLRL